VPSAEIARTREQINFEKMERAKFRRIDGVLPSGRWVNGWWVNEDARIAFNNEGVEDAASSWLDTAITEKVPPVNFVFYFAYGTKMDEGLCNEMLERLGLSKLDADMRLIIPAR